MLEIRLHGRGGQGAVTAAELVAQAAISEGNYAQGFPSFGPERRGAPVTAFIRVSHEPILLREPIENPDVVVVMDPSLIGLVDMSEGQKPGGLLIVNTGDPQDQVLKDLAGGFALAWVNASAIAIEVLRVPIVNTAIIGSLVKASSLCSLDSLQEPLKHRFGPLAGKNWSAMQRAYDETRVIGDFQPQAAKSDETGPYSIDALFAYGELEPGADVAQPGNSRDFHTGDWRTMGKPVTDLDKCIKCGFCWLYCPDIAYRQNPDGFFDWDGRYCKGCGICALECPKHAIEMMEEAS